jgi:hypothetical protein
MTDLTPDQRNYYYLIAAERTGIHKPILAALNQVHDSPLLGDKETGLGMMPANEVALEDMDTFAEQVQYAANTIRGLTNNLIQQGWKGKDLFCPEKDAYTDAFLQLVAEGYTPSSNEKGVARLKPCNLRRLREAYSQDITTDYDEQQLPAHLPHLDKTLLSLAERIADHFIGLSHQRESLLEAARLWHKLETGQAVVQSIAESMDKSADELSQAEIDQQLQGFVKRLSFYYGGYPHQRESLIRLAQLWRQLPTREAAIQSLQENTAADPDLNLFDPALMAFVQRLPHYYQGKGTQRNAITEAVRIWRKLNTRTAALASLGVESEQLVATTSRTILAEIASQVDRALIDFVKRIPNAYEELPHQRESLIRLVQLWRKIGTRQEALAVLTEEVKGLEEQKKAQDFPILVTPPPSRPERWTTKNIQLSMSIIPDGNFTWAEATHGGTRMPPNQATVEAMVRLAKLAQRGRDRVGRPFIVTSWYRPPHINKAVGGARYSRHVVGDGMDFVVENLSGNQIYWLLDPWWTGGLGRYRRFPNLCHIDARGSRARWRY